MDAQTKIKVFVRHCNFSANSANKIRPEWYTTEKCWDNLNNTADADTSITAFFDGTPNESHFLYNKDIDIICMNGGSDGHSFLNLLNYVNDLNIEDDTIIYFLEDDFYHRKGWPAILREGFQYIGVDYITLYDHSDKYDDSMYGDLQSKIIATPSIHWRTTPSTTNTYAMLSQTLRKHLSIHLEYCDLNKGFTHDHAKFTRLWQEGGSLISCIPGYSTHCELNYLSPTINWNNVNSNS
jgi:hypothetical protein